VVVEDSTKSTIRLALVILAADLFLGLPFAQQDYSSSAVPATSSSPAARQQQLRKRQQHRCWQRAFEVGRFATPLQPTPLLRRGRGAEFLSALGLLAFLLAARHISGGSGSTAAGSARLRASLPHSSAVRRSH
jgi:hypothetical protein